jgi:hypothetical protein
MYADVFQIFAQLIAKILGTQTRLFSGVKKAPGSRIQIRNTTVINRLTEQLEQTQQS